MRAPVSHIADLKPAAGSSAEEAVGKAWVLEGKCHQCHSVGQRNTQTMRREAINTPSVSGRLRHRDLRRAWDETKCLIEGRSYVRAMSMT